MHSETWIASAITFTCISGGYSVVLSPNDAGIALAMGVFKLVLELATYTIGSKIVSAAELALLSMTEVLLDPLWVWIFLNETIA